MAEGKANDLEYAVLGMGNPLLDISADVDDAFLAKYGVTMNNAILAEEAHLPIYQDMVDNLSPNYIAGGATQNTIRVCQWMMQAPNATSYFGCVGKDAFGESLYNCATADGVNVMYHQDEATPTGVCACLIKDKERSLVTNLQAANNYSKDHLMREDIQAVWKKAKIAYSAGFFITVSVPSMLEVAAYCQQDASRRFAINLSAPFIPQFFFDPLNELISFADILLGNESEAAAYAARAGWGEDLSSEDIAQRLHDLPRADASRGHVVIITQGAGATIVVTAEGMQSFAVPPVAADEIVDLNGAGDAFVGGLLSQLAKGKTVAEAVQAGHYSAGVIIRVSGTALPETPPDAAAFQ